MKRCPFCAEEIQDAAVVCKHCHRDLSGKMAEARIDGFVQEIIHNNSPAKIVIAVLLICSVGAFLFRPDGETLSELAFAGACGVPAVGFFLLIPAKMGNLILRLGYSILLGFGVAAVGTLVMRAAQ